MGIIKDILFENDTDQMKNFGTKRIVFMSNLLTITGFLTHILYLFIFLLQHNSPLVFANFISITVYWSCFWIGRMFSIKYSIYICTIEVMVYAVVSTAVIGIESWSLIYILVALIPHYLFLETTVKKLIAFTIFAVFCFNLGLIIIQFYGSSNMKTIPNWFKYFNFNFFLFVLIIELNLSSFTEKIIKDTYKQNLEIALLEAFKDPLTNLWNRRYLENRFLEINTLIENNIKISIAILDIDKFKNINDTYGHNIGDEVLKFFSKELLINFRNTDLIVRFGGEEFLIVLIGMDEIKAYNKIDEFRNYISEQVLNFTLTPISITFSTGICELNKNIQIEDSFKVADDRLYVAKNKGRNIVINSENESNNLSAI